MLITSRGGTIFLTGNLRTFRSAVGGALVTIFGAEFGLDFMVDVTVGLDFPEAGDGGGIRDAADLGGVGEGGGFGLTNLRIAAGDFGDDFDSDTSIPRFAINGRDLRDTIDIV